MAGSSTEACADLRVHVAQARDRKRLRCVSRTTWGHQNLVDWVQNALPPSAGWRVLGPPAPCEAPTGPTQYPPEGGVGELRDLFLAAGVAVGVVDSLDLQDRIDGHCETCAAALSEHVLAQLELGTVPAEEA